MEMNNKPLRRLILAGDVIGFTIVTLVGFASHGTLTTAGSRIWPIFIPLTASWLLLAAALNLYDLKTVEDPRQLWRPVVGTVFAVPMAAWMRGLWLGSSILPVFITILIGVSALILFIWRSLILAFLLIRRRGHE
jgi:4-hydroxybenzoate polyprenyltransferase